MKTGAVLHLPQHILEELGWDVGKKVRLSISEDKSRSLLKIEGVDEINDGSAGRMTE